MTVTFGDKDFVSLRREEGHLGLNVLEYFNYYVDTENTRLYMKLNPNPTPYDPMIACGKIFTVS